MKRLCRFLCFGAIGFFATFSAASAAVDAPSGLAASPAPPAATDPPEIGRVRVTEVCDALKARIAPALFALMKNDEALSGARRGLVKMGDAAGDNSLGDINPGLGMDRAHILQLTSLAQRNLKIVAALLGPQANAADAGTDSAAATAAAALRKVAAQQSTAVNLISGLLQTDQMGQMEQEFAKCPLGPCPIKADGTVDTWGRDTHQTYLDFAGLPNGPADWGVKAPLSPDEYAINPRSLAAVKMRGHTLYDAASANLGSIQVSVASAESAASDAVVDTVKVCTGAKPASSPVPASNR